MFLQPGRPRPSGPQESFKRKLQQNGVDQCGVAARRYTAGCCYRSCGCLLIPFATSERVWKIGRLNNITTADSLSTESSKTNSYDFFTDEPNQCKSRIRQASKNYVYSARWKLLGGSWKPRQASQPWLVETPKSYEFKTKSPWQFSVSFESRAFSRWHSYCLYWRLNISFLLQEIQNIFTLNYLIEIIYLDHIGKEKYLLYFVNINL